MITFISHPWTDPANDARSWPLTVSATAIARPVLDLLTGPQRAARVHSAYSQAANLEVGGRFVTLTAAAASWLPNGLVLSCTRSERALLGLRPGQHAWIGEGEIRFPDAALRITGEGADLWEPSLARNLDPVSLAALAAGFRHLAALSPPEEECGSGRGQGKSPKRNDLLAPFTEAIRGALDILVDGLARRDRAAVLAGTHRLAGLGPGSTPAGDDILVGACAALTLLASAGEPLLRNDAAALLELRRLIAETAAAQTTALSAAWLTHAGGGEFSLPLIWLGQALASSDRPAILAAADTLVRLGASSGRCALRGLLAAGQALIRRYTAGA